MLSEPISHHIRVVLLHLPEVKCTGDEQQGNHPDRDQYHRPRYLGAEQRPAEPFDDAGHGIQAIEEPYRFGNKARRVYDRRCEQPKLDQEGDGILKVAVLDVQGREPEPDAERCGKGEEDEEREEYDIQGRDESVQRHHDDKDEKRKNKVHERRQDPGEGHNQAGEVDLGHDVGIGDHAGCGAGDPFGKQCPGKQGCENEERVGYAIRRDLGKPSEEHRKDQHHEERLDDRPEEAERGLLVPDLHVAPRERGEQLPVVPEFTEVDRDPFFRGADMEIRRRTCSLQVPGRNHNLNYFLFRAY
jgi:hypothetical protein